MTLLEAEYKAVAKETLIATACRTGGGRVLRVVLRTERYSATPEAL